jgi:hypothetical protein
MEETIQIREYRRLIMQANEGKTVNRAFRVESGKIYFTRATERRIFFVLTIAMLTAGVMIKLGVF